MGTAAAREGGVTLRFDGVAGVCATRGRFFDEIKASRRLQRRAEI